MPSAPLISVLLAVRNGERFLARALSSIVDQSLPDFEVIAIDDGSDDATGQIMAEYAERDRRVRGHTQEPCGVIAARNTAFALSTGKYIAMLDADDMALADRFERQVRFLEQHRDVGLVGSGALVIDEQGRRIGRLDYPADDAAIRVALSETNPFCHSATMMRRSVFELAGGYRRAFTHSAEDYDLWLRIADYCQLANLSEPVVCYRWHPAQVSSTRKASVQLLEHVAAQVSAELRRAHKPDPLDDCDVVSIDLLTTFGVQMSSIQSRLVAGAAARAAVSVSLGRPREASDLLAEILAGVELTTISRRARAQLGVAYARVKSAEGDPAAAASWLLKGLAANPLLVLQAACRAGLAVMEPRTRLRSSRA